MNNCYCYLFFFFQAEDGIRDRNVTGVQTCALPISWAWHPELPRPSLARAGATNTVALREPKYGARYVHFDGAPSLRSEERRVGKSVDLGGRRIIKKKKDRERRMIATEIYSELEREE